jgi:FKBP-type peptidyl-prolyl cis-trans isomerase 2
LTVDRNHPLAGQTAKFHVTTTDLRPAAPEEIRNGRPDLGAAPLQ